jgi:hypothetical protein
VFTQVAILLRDGQESKLGDVDVCIFHRIFVMYLGN